MRDVTVEALPTNVIEAFDEERKYQKSKVINGVPMDQFDQENSQGDWIAYIVRYASGVHLKLGWSRDERSFRDAMVKVGTLAAAAIENYDAGFCSEEVAVEGE